MGDKNANGWRIILFNSKDKFLVVSDNLTLEAITHEAGHVVFNEKNSIKGNRLFAYNIFLDTEVFAIYSSDVALRPIKLEILNLQKQLHEIVQPQGSIANHNQYAV